MKYINKKTLKFLGTVSILFFGIIILSYNINNYSFYSENYKIVDEIGTSNDNSAVIHIDGNWSDTSYDGDGSYSNPYKIEDEIIDATGYDIGILIANSSDYFIIENCTIIQSEIGVKLQNVSNGKLSNLSISNINGEHATNNGEDGSIGAGIFLQNSSNTTLINNSISTIRGGDGYTGTSTLDGGDGGTGAGIYINCTDMSQISSINNTIFDILAGAGGESGGTGSPGTSGVGVGIFLDCSNGTDISSINNTIFDIMGGEGASNANGGLGVGIYLLAETSEIIVINNTIFDIVGGKEGVSAQWGKGYGIYLDHSLNNTITGNEVSYCNHSSIRLYHSDNNTLISNTGSNSGWYGIYLEYSDNNNLTDNTVSQNNRDGIIIVNYSNNNTIVNNTASQNIRTGIFIAVANENTLKNNVVINNGEFNGYVYEWCGIHIISSDQIIVIENDVTNNGIGGVDDSGIFLDDSCYNTIKNNTITNNNQYGIRLRMANNNTIVYNNISNNIYQGVYLTHFNNPLLNSNNNTLYYNYFINNSVNALDYGLNNQWDNGSIGNYWGDYTGEDLNSDGIGDTPYNISGTANSQDHFPIWKGPFIKIIIPLENEIFGTNAPEFEVNISDPELNYTWYTINDGQNFLFSENETINQAEWDSLSDGVANIIFYANDSDGYINSRQVNINKDTTAPTIDIISPSSGGNFNLSAPEFTVEITEINSIDKMWYSLNGGQNFTFTSNETINQAEWDSLSDGLITITFFANDTVGNLASETVFITKDTSTEDGSNGAGGIPSYPIMIYLPLTVLMIMSVVLIVRKKINN